MRSPLSQFLMPAKRPPNVIYAIYPDGQRTQINKRTSAGYEYAPGMFASPLSYARERAAELGARFERKGGGAC